MSTITTIPAFWTLRGDCDRAVKQEVYDGNEYQLPESLANKLVLDLGANIGSFARLALERGAKVYCVEPDPDNVRILRDNLSGFPQESAAVLEAAVGRHHGPVALSRGGEPTSYTTSRRFHHNVVQVRCFTMPEILADFRAAMMDDSHPLIDILKMDIEGAEYEVIESGFFFPYVRRLDIEFHGCHVENAWDRALACRKRLSKLGFKEERWERIHPERNWCLLYRGAR